MSRRYAIYFAPEESSALARFGWPWLGREPSSTTARPLPALGWTPEFHDRIVASPRLYGLHATLKPPFALADGTSGAELREAAAQFCARQAKIGGGALMLAEIDGFLALCPGQPEPEIEKLAAACVEFFDSFRAPPSPDERAKRLAHPLSRRQIELLDRWGYPYVMEQFRFHVTLTGRLSTDDQSIARWALESRLTEVVAEPLRIESLCIFEQADAGQWFTLSERIPLRGSPPNS